MENQSKDKIDLTNVKTQFDEVLVKHIRRLIEIETLAASLSFNLSTIACLLLLVERENEIKKSPQSPPERYTRETFLDDLSNIGVEIDDTLMVSFQALAQHGYVAIDSNNRYNAQIAAFALVSFLDNLFPGMRGLNLVAYVLQMMDEVTCGRKELKEALDQFDQTLLSKGIPLSEQSTNVVEKESLRKPVQHTPRKAETTKISDDLKKALDHKLSRLRTSSVDRKDTTSIISSKDSMGRTEIKEVFPKGPTEEEIKAQEAEKKAKKEADEREAREAEEKAAREAERIAAEKAAQEAEKKAAELSAREAEIKAAEIAAREAEMKAKEAEIKAREAEIAAREAEKTEAEKIALEEQEKEASKFDIEQKMAAFQQQIAIPCPICQMGKIISDTTEKGQEYFSCTNENCGFISWGKPYPFSCPICSSQFLIEFTTQEGAPGLKCSRSTCSFWQSHLGQPTIDNKSSDEPKKRRKLVRRVKRRK